MDQILQFTNTNEHLEFLVNFDDCTGANPVYTCQEWGNLYQELGEYGNYPTILNGDDDLNQDGNPDHHIWNSFANNAYSAYAMIDHHMVVRYLFDMPNLYQFQYNYIPTLINTMYGCMDQSACNYNQTAVYDDGSCQYMEECNDCNEFFSQLTCNQISDCMWMGNHCVENSGLCSNYLSHLECIEQPGCFWMGDHCMQGSSCFDPIAENFNPMAAATGLDDNTTCIYSPYIEFGCTYPHAVNFNPDAIVDDASCQFSYNDVNADGIIDILDIVIILLAIIDSQ